VLKLGLKNFRRLRAVEPIDIKPITILLGKNSSGKSSFLRALPLLKQSILTRSNAPVLWYGDFVDFGSFQTTVTDNDLTKHLTITYVLDNVSDRDATGPLSFQTYDEDIETGAFVEFKATQVQVETELTGDDITTRFHKIILTVPDLAIVGTITFDKTTSITSLTVGDIDVIPLLGGVVDTFGSSNLLPPI
jgi:predicted ATPase